MRRPRLRTALLISFLGVILVLLGGIYLLPGDETVIDGAFFSRLKIGMTEAEVIAAAGAAPGDYTGAYSYSASAPLHEGELPIYVDYHLGHDGKATAPHPSTGQPLRGTWWRGQRGLVIVFYDANGRVNDRRFYPGKAYSWVGYHADRFLP